MRLTQLRLLAIMAGMFMLPATFRAQDNCVPTNINGTTITLPCNQLCQSLVFQIPHLKSSSNYVLNSIPYEPYAYVTPDATQDLLLYCDDIYSGKFSLPFSFCFYDSLFSKIVIGSNGLITFDTTNASCGNAYPISPAIPSTGGGTQCSAFSTYYPKAAIMLAYSDIDPRPKDPSALCPDINASLPDRKIEWRVEGAAPCRRFVVSYYHVGTFGRPNTDPMNTMQIVLHESTGIIDFFYENRTTNSSTNGGRAIMGIQNWNRDKATFHPLRNATVWPAPGAINEGWRFTPSGGVSRFVSSQIFTMSGTLLATADTSTITAGLLNLNFPNICAPSGATQFKIVTTFSACQNPSTLLTTVDTITVDRSNGLNATAAATNSPCGPPSGTITLTVPAGAGSAPYTFVLNGTVTQTGASPMVFNNVAPGAHTVVITDASGGCTSTLNVTVNQNNNLAATLTPTATACAGVSNGSIAVNPTTGSAPYTFTLNPGNVVQTGATANFTGLASGAYTVSVTDASGCTTVPALSTSVGTGAGLNVSATSSATACLGGSSGTITVNPTNGTGPFTFVLDNNVTQTGNTTTFTNVPAGPHTIRVTDALGCTNNSVNVNVDPGPALVTTATHTNVLCNGGLTGTITVTQPTVGIPPFQYSLDGTTWQASNVFNGLGAGNYTVYYREAGGCMGQITKTIDQPTALNASASTLPATCNGLPNGSITVVAAGGTAPYEYSVNGGSWQSSNTFNVVAGTHTVSIRDANQCITTQTVTVTQPGSMMGTFTTSNATCNGGNDGTISLSATGGNTSYEYSLDGTSFQPSNLFNTAPGTYTATIRDNLGCIITVPNIVVGLTNDLTYTPAAAPTICEGTSTQLSITSNALQYSWSPATGLNNPSVSNPVANPTVTTTYMVTLTYGRCSTDVPVTVNVNAAPLPNAGADGFICYGQSYQLQASGGTQFTWTPSTYLSSTDIPNPTSTPDRTITYSLSVVDANGCSSLVTDEIKVDVTPPIKVTTFPFDTVAYEGDQFQLLATSVATDYVWTPSIGLDNPNVPNPILTAGQVGDMIVYKVTASTQAGCRGEGYVRLRVYKGPELYVPTGFTPNGDGKNDTFFPFPVGVKSIKYFRVFNRWGQMLFSTSTLNHGWDGKFGGIEQGSGVYVWMVEGLTLDNRPITKKGTITLIR